MTKQRSYIFYLEDMQTAMLRVQEYIAGHQFESFILDNKTVDAVVRNFEVIGEAAKNIPPVIKECYPAIPWKEMYRLRNKISHEYFGIDYQILWQIATEHLPENLAQIREVITNQRS